VSTGAPKLQNLIKKSWFWRLVGGFSSDTTLHTDEDEIWHGSMYQFIGGSSRKK